MLINVSKSRLSGFSLVELMVAVTITLILMAVAMPNFRAWLLNSQIRNAAESIQNGLQRARGEAVARNADVEFVLANAVPNDQTSWTVKAAGPGGAVYDSRKSLEGSLDVIRTTTQGASTVTFDLTGRPKPNLDGSPQLTVVHLDVPVALLPAAQSQDLNVTIDFSGKIKMCDPNEMNANNPRFCN